MGEVFQHRLIISGFEVEYYHYKDNSIYRGFENGPRKKREGEAAEKKVQTEKAQSSVNRTRKEIRRRINSNLQLTKFLTLTSTCSDIGVMNKEFNLYTQRMKDKFPEFQYLAVPEFQKDVDYFGNPKPNGGAVHYHLLCNLRYVQNQKLAGIWRHGFIQIKQIKNPRNLGRYLCKYLGKDMFDERMFRKKKYFCSQDLSKPLEMVGKNVKTFLKKNEHNLKLIWEKTINIEYVGEVDYKLFNFTTLGLDLVWNENE